VIPLSDAQEYVLSGCEPLGTDSVASVDALGLVTAEPIVSNEQIPPFDNTAVDGFAVIAADTATVPTELAIAGGIAAGEAPSVPVTPGSAIRIMTGAPMPDGADAVVMVEDTEASADDATVTIKTTVSAGSAVRKAGEDMQPGQTVFPPSTLLQPGHLGVLATLGIESIATHRRPPSPAAPPSTSGSSATTKTPSRPHCETAQLAAMRSSPVAASAWATSTT